MRKRLMQIFLHFLCLVDRPLNLDTFCSGPSIVHVTIVHTPKFVQKSPVVMKLHSQTCLELMIILKNNSEKGLNITCGKLAGTICRGNRAIWFFASHVSMIELQKMEIKLVRKKQVLRLQAKKSKNEAKLMPIFFALFRVQ